MPYESHVHFKNVERSDAIVSFVEEHIEKLKSHYELIKCEVTIEKPHKHHHKGSHYDIHIHAQTQYGIEHISTANRKEDSRLEDVKNAVQEAFHIADRIFKKDKEKRNKKH